MTSTKLITEWHNHNAEADKVVCDYDEESNTSICKMITTAVIYALNA